MKPIFKSNFQVATLTIALFAASVQSAHAGLVITSATRSVLAETAISTIDVNSAVSTSGIFDERAISRGGSNPADETAPAASASQETDITNFASSKFMSGFGRAEANSDGFTATNAESKFSVLFTIDGTFGFRGTATLVGNAAAGGSALFDLFEINADGSISNLFSGTDLAALPQPFFGGVLDSGNYGLTVSARATTSSFSDSFLDISRGFFQFSMSFLDAEQEPVDPPNNVPEPGSLALMLAGALAFSATRKRV
jgi:hypothetical protein